MSGKIRSIVVDTLTALQENQYMRDSSKPGFDEWTDFGKAVFTFIDDLLLKNFDVILILGEPGTGKSSGLRTLPSKSNIWFNNDRKNPTWIGGEEEYGKKFNPTPRFHVIPQSYEDIITVIDKVIAAGMFEDDKYAILTAHTETYKVGNLTKERLKTLGKQATKMRIEGKLETVLYSRTEKSKGKTVYILETENDSFNTARSKQQSKFPPKIPNDYNYIINRLMGVECIPVE